MVEHISNEEIENELFQEFLQDFREKYIPERYNQIKLLNELNNPDIDHFISISNRTDGKSFNYIHALLHISIEYNVGLMLICRNTYLRESYQTLLDDIINFSPIYNRSDFTFIRGLYYISLNYKGDTVAIITDLNHAGELKYYSNFIKNFPIMIYDEFLALDTDYLSDEFERLQTIYESIDRKKEFPLIVKPKIFYLGNAMNFNSPILNGLNIFNILEKHKMNTARIYKYEFHVMLEMNKNTNANMQRNTRAFNSGNTSMSTGEFKTNSHLIADDNDRKEILKNPRTFYVKLRDDFMKVHFNYDTLKVILSITSVCPDDYYIYNLELKDNTSDSTYLKETYFDENQYKRIDNGYYLFDNNYSRNLIATEYPMLNMLKIHKLINEFILTDTKTELEHKEQQFKENYIELTKRNLMKRLME